jgi:outer membrane immunogenic protein
MKKLLFAVAALLIGSAAVPALAEEAPAGTLVPGAQLAQMPPPPPLVSTWTGWYIGINGGWVDSDKNSVLNTGTDVGAAGLGSALALPGPFGGRAIPNKFNLSYDGWQVGGTVGYNLQVAPQWVLGFEIDADGGNGSKTASFAFPGSAAALPFTSTFKRSIGFLSTDRLRAGFLPMPNLMLFGTAGLAWGETSEGASWNCPTCVPPTATQAATSNNSHRWGAGLAWGGGAEWMFLPNWSVKAEYIRADLGTTTANITYNYGPGGTTGTRSTLASASHFVDDIVRVGLNFHFAPPPPPPAAMAVQAPPPAAPRVFIVFFDWDKDRITPEGMAIIQQAADAYKSGAPVQIQVTGYTDRSGSAGYNQRLSERRANNVAKALAALGVPPAQMAVSGHGENDNRVPTADGVREPQNRRVEIVAP